MSDNTPPQQPRLLPQPLYAYAIQAAANNRASNSRSNSKSPPAVPQDLYLQPNNNGLNEQSGDSNISGPNAITGTAIGNAAGEGSGSWKSALGYGRQLMIPSQGASSSPSPAEGDGGVEFRGPRTLQGGDDDPFVHRRSQSMGASSAKPNSKRRGISVGSGAKTREGQSKGPPSQSAAATFFSLVEGHFFAPTPEDGHPNEGIDPRHERSHPRRRHSKFRRQPNDRANPADYHPDFYLGRNNSRSSSASPPVLNKAATLRPLTQWDPEHKRQEDPSSSLRPQSYPLASGNVVNEESHRPRVRLPHPRRHSISSTSTSGGRFTGRSRSSSLHSQHLMVSQPPADNIRSRSVSVSTIFSENESTDHSQHGYSASNSSELQAGDEGTDEEEDYETEEEEDGGPFQDRRRGSLDVRPETGGEEEETEGEWTRGRLRSKRKKRTESTRRRFGMPVSIGNYWASRKGKGNAVESEIETPGDGWYGLHNLPGPFGFSSALGGFWSSMPGPPPSITSSTTSLDPITSNAAAVPLPPSPTPGAPPLNIQTTNLDSSNILGDSTPTETERTQFLVPRKSTQLSSPFTTDSLSTWPRFGGPRWPRSQRDVTAIESRVDRPLSLDEERNNAPRFSSTFDALEGGMTDFRERFYPNLPHMPSFPQFPNLPNLPTFPNLSYLPNLPNLPNMAISLPNVSMPTLVITTDHGVHPNSPGIPNSAGRYRRYHYTSQPQLGGARSMSRPSPRPPTPKPELDDGGEQTDSGVGTARPEDTTSSTISRAGRKKKRSRIRSLPASSATKNKPMQEQGQLTQEPATSDAKELPTIQVTGPSISSSRDLDPTMFSTPSRRKHSSDHPFDRGHPRLRNRISEETFADSIEHGDEPGLATDVPSSPGLAAISPPTSTGHHFRLYFRPFLLPSTFLLFFPLALLVYRLRDLPNHLHAEMFGDTSISMSLPVPVAGLTIYSLFLFLTSILRFSQKSYLMVPFTDERGYRNPKLSDDGWAVSSVMPILLAGGCWWDSYRGLASATANLSDASPIAPPTFDGIATLPKIWDSLNLSSPPSTDPSRVWLGTELEDYVALVSGRAALLQLMFINSIVLSLSLLLSSTILKIRFLPLNNARRWVGANLLAMGIAGIVWFSLWLATFIAGMNLQPLRELFPPSLQDDLSALLAKLPPAILSPFKLFFTAVAPVRSFVRPSEAALSVFVCQISHYMISRLARRGFTLGELSVVSATGNSLLLEGWRLTRSRWFYPRGHPYVPELFRTATPLVSYQHMLIPGVFFIGFCLSPLLIVSRHLAQQRSYRLKWPAEKDRNRKIVALGVYLGTAAIIVFILAAWASWILGPYVSLVRAWGWVTQWVFLGGNGLQRGAKGWAYWRRIFLIIYWVGIVSAAVGGWQTRLIRQRKVKIQNLQQQQNLSHTHHSPQASPALTQPGTLSLGKKAGDNVREDKKMHVSVNLRRKFFHALAVLMFVPGIAIDPAFSALAFSLAFAGFTLVEYARYFALYPVGAPLHLFFSEFVDSKDSGPVILSHFLLLAGCGGALWLEGSGIKQYTGVLTLGVGDALASIIGKRVGRLRWPSSSKTIEGTLAFIVSVHLCALFLRFTRIVDSFNTSRYLFATVCTGLLEGTSNQNDNIVVPIYMWSILALLDI